MYGSVRGVPGNRHSCRDCIVDMLRGTVINSSLKWSKYEREEISIRGRYGNSNNKRKRQSKIRGSAG